jgi:hypothetical protein
VGILKFEKKFGFFEGFDKIFHNPVDSAIVKDAVRCADEPTCFMCAAVYHSISVFIKDLDLETYRSRGNWTDEDNRPLLCEIEGGVLRTMDLAIMAQKGIPSSEFIDDVSWNV